MASLGHSAQPVLHYERSKHIWVDINFLFMLTFGTLDQLFGFWPCCTNHCWFEPCTCSRLRGQITDLRFTLLVFSRKLFGTTYPMWDIVHFPAENYFLIDFYFLLIFYVEGPWKFLFFESKGFLRPRSTFVTYSLFFFISELLFKRFEWSTHSMI